jgi:hypothetical protein
MQDSLRALKVALRVITAIAPDRHEPDPRDIAELESLAPELRGLPPDELACEVIHLALRRRAELRTIEIADAVVRHGGTYRGTRTISKTPTRIAASG